MAETWTRAESVPHPSIWDMFDGPKPLPNGQIPRFRIQDTTDDLIDETVEHMKRTFLIDEPYCAILGMGDDEESIEEMGVTWKHVLKYHVGLVAILDNPDELDDKTLPKIAGCNMTMPIFPGTKDPEMKNAKIKSVINLVNTVSHKVDCFAKYNTPVIMYALGLSVDPVFRGQGIGEKLLRARFPLGRALGIPLTMTVFTAKASQYLAKKVGFEVIAEMNSEDYKENDVEIFKGVDCKIIQLMVAKIE